MTHHRKYRPILFAASLAGGLLPAWILFFLFLSYTPAHGQDQKVVRVGIFTDCQYCDCNTDGKRHYRLSLSKLDKCVQEFNSQSLEGVFHLGDMIDHDYKSYDSVLPRFRQFNAPLHLVLGNHDYMIRKKVKPGLLEHIGMKEDHYVVDLAGWRFIVLNGDDLSFSAPQDREHKNERYDMVNDLYSQLEFNALPWNGGIGKAQMAWLERQLDSSREAHKKVIILCHFPLFTKTNHNLFNNKEVFALISKYDCVKAYFNGHYHSGDYKVMNGIHLVNFRGMVDTDKNAFAVVTLTDDSILIKGYGREPDRVLKIR